MKCRRLLLRSTVCLLLCSLPLAKALADDGILVQRTYVAAKDQTLQAFKKYGHSNLLVLFSGNLACSQKGDKYLKKDTITGLAPFIDSLKCGKLGYRLVFRNSRNEIDSVYQFDAEYVLTDKALRKAGFISFLAIGKKGEITDQFDFDLREKYGEIKDMHVFLDELFRKYEVYSYTDRDKYSLSSVWILSVGINDYGSVKYRNCESDARTIVDLFTSHYKKRYRNVTASQVHSYLLLDTQATKSNILAALQDIARKSNMNDYFIFNFSGQSYIFTSDSVNYGTYFFPYDAKGRIDKPEKRNPQAPGNILDQLLSMQLFQEFVQQIPVQNQLFISEAGPSQKFRSEFIKALMQSSVEVAALLNKNRIIIVPNNYGLDYAMCNDSMIQQGPINYYLSQAGRSSNVYDIFGDDDIAGTLAYKIKNVSHTCRQFNSDYFDIFFERKFLKEYREMLGAENATRGFKGKSTQLKRELNDLTGRRYALLVGTDHYKGSGWKDLANPVKDVNAVADVLRELYGFEVQVLEDQPMDTIFSTIGSYYRKVQPNDQVIIYFAGHGDADDELLSDGFIVCSDSRSPEQDIARNTYISYLKLQKMINNLSARQVLVMLDVCHGGVFDQKAFDKQKRDNPVTSNISNRNVLELLRDKLPLRTRKFLSSVGAESAFDGLAGKHSPFANQLLQILTTQAKDENGVVLLSDIYSVMVKSSLNETATLKISPYMADFGNVDAFTEFIFIPSGGNE